MDALDSGTNKGFTGGGSHNDSTGAGRWSAKAQLTDTTDTETGFRCVIELDPTAYE